MTGRNMAVSFSGPMAMFSILRVAHTNLCVRGKSPLELWKILTASAAPVCRDLFHVGAKPHP